MSYVEKTMIIETMIARTEHQLMQAEVAQMQSREGVVVQETHIQRGADLIARIRSLFTRTHVWRKTMKWITRERVKVDRVACPWLIKNFVDAQAEFLFVPADKVMEIAARENAIPYDVKDVELGHHGQECSFEAILKKYQLTGDPALVLLGRIVNGADTDNTLWNQPEGAGLEAVAEGFRHLGYTNDMEQNRAEWIVYDALYAYCKESVKQGKPGGMFR